MINITYSKTGFISLCLEQVSMPKANIFHVRCHKKPENSEEKKSNQSSSDICKDVCKETKEKEASAK